MGKAWLQHENGPESYSPRALLGCVELIYHKASVQPVQDKQIPIPSIQRPLDTAVQKLKRSFASIFTNATVKNANYRAIKSKLIHGNVFHVCGILFILINWNFK